MKRVLSLVLATGLAAACSPSYSGETAYALPSGAMVISLPTQADPRATGCVLLRLGPVRVDWDASQRSVSFGGEKVLWPRGYSARLLPNGRLEIVAPDGTIVARDGDMVEFNGPDYQHVCSVLPAAP